VAAPELASSPHAVTRADSRQSRVRVRRMSTPGGSRSRRRCHHVGESASGHDPVKNDGCSPGCLGSRWFARERYAAPSGRGPGCASARVSVTLRHSRVSHAPASGWPRRPGRPPRRPSNGFR
jgi:hypothetical protein